MRTMWYLTEPRFGGVSLDKLIMGLRFFQKANKMFPVDLKSRLDWDAHLSNKKTASKSL